MIQLNGILGDLQKATLDARAATGVRGISTRSKQGLIQVVNFTQRGRKTVVDELSEYVPIEWAIDKLRAMAQEPRTDHAGESGAVARAGTVIVDSRCDFN